MAEPIDEPTGLPLAVLDRWSLGCEGPTVERPDGTQGVTFTLIRVLGDDESDAVVQAAELLHWQVNSPYNRLNDKFEAFFAAVEEAREALATRGRTPPALIEPFAEILTAFRVYLNHTPKWIRDRYGADSAVETAWTRACSEEYDRSFDYRLAYNLRNESDHRTHVVDVKLQARVTGPESAEQRVSVTLKDEVLDHALRDRRWQAKVRHELKTRPRPIDGDRLMRSLFASLQRILATTTLVQRESIEGAIHTVRDLAHDVDCDGALRLMRYGLSGPDWPRTTQELTMQPLPLSAADTMEQALVDAAAILWPAFVMPLHCSGPMLDLQGLKAPLAVNSSVSLVAVGFATEAGHYAVLRAPSAEVARQAVVEAALDVWPPGIGLDIGAAVPLDDEAPS